MTELDFDLFISLVELDREIHTIQKDLDADLQRQALYQNQLAQLNQSLLDARTIVQTARKKLDLQDLELKVLDDQEREKKERMSNASSPKEYFSLEQEIAQIQKKKIDYENQIINLWEEINIAEKAYDAIAATTPERLKEAEENLSNAVRRASYLEQDLHARDKQRNELVKHVPADLLETYTMMQRSVPNPVVPVVRDSCSGCFNKLTSQEVISVQKKQLITCKECYRKLYAPVEVRQT